MYVCVCVCLCICECVYLHIHHNLFIPSVFISVEFLFCFVLNSGVSSYNTHLYCGHMFSFLINI
jgi:hypothetical protein